MLTKEQIVAMIMRMKNGDDMTTPQDEYASGALAYYAAAFPEWKLNRAVSEAMAKAEAMKEAEK